MLKIPTKHSINLSIAISALFFVLCIAGAFILPTLVPMLIDTPDNIGTRADISDSGRTLVMVTSYLILADMLAANCFLFSLLQRVKKGLVFTEKSVFLIRSVSWCCYIICLLFIVLGIYFQLAFVVSFLAFFLGLCLRVTKNVIDEATQIKNENDLTV